MKKIILLISTCVFNIVALAQTNIVSAPGFNTISLSPGDSASPVQQPSYMNVFVVPDKELIVIQWKNLNTENREISLSDASGKLIQKTILHIGSTIAYFDTNTIYSGKYVITVLDGNNRLNTDINFLK